ncbi:MAG: flagellar motor protein MotP [Spirochaetes bacterium GWD1_61_31]|nr:MAG: flagellar motor protein MotP [Spirochaetes bacterium GWB1_60_80]OHD28521.1 MAG: flagellar motor protein MotP [Spirochaetes bacterium GWC1_61_12]OHD42183.1 MAG: flagellar motor protein MotP [Spirochaetes bacterium GWD1_61_31]OHD44513.1 MAG: flagellar motor protein MotP [Spirochaetes bacterium GWE1_60_18]OHD59335.1 MAG: flagellar motor protein MotP [Spirochaetes bacterium GWF1_60_12]HAP43168.1 motility protein A [Spirochaetaceae bacterium]
MDFATIIGLVGGIGCILLSMITAGATPLTYADLPSFFMTVMGSWFALMINYTIKDMLDVFKILGKVGRTVDYGEMKVAEALISLSERARREGILSLEEEIESLDNMFMKRGLRMVVDSVDPEVIRNIMETELNQLNDRHGKWLKMLDQWAKLAPGMGMLGTVQGLIAMMKNLEDTASIGRNMAVALVTTYYGAMMANFLIMPMMGKLAVRDAAETKVWEMVIEGVLSIQQGDNPHILQMKLTSYLTPAGQKQLDEAHPQT